MTDCWRRGFYSRLKENDCEQLCAVEMTEKWTNYFKIRDGAAGVGDVEGGRSPR